MTIKSLSAEQIVQLLLELKPTEGTHAYRKQDHRNYTIALCLLDAGLRVGEVTRLTADNLWAHSEPVKSIIVCSKIAEKGSERQIPVTQRLSEAIRIMYHTFWAAFFPSVNPFAFYTRHPHKAISTRQIQRIIGDAGIHGPGIGVHPHMLRHTFATRLMRTTSTRIVQELLGHKRLTSTQIYTHPNSTDLETAILDMESQP